MTQSDGANHGCEVLRRLSEGAAAEVLLAREELGAHVILEVMRPEVLASAELVTRFLAEVENRRALTHPHVLERVRTGALPDGRHWFVSAPVGESLSAVLRARGPLRPAEVVPLALSLCDALHAFHSRGLVHGNVQPATVWVAPKGPPWEAKLLDFGLAFMRPGRTLPRPPGRVLVEAEYLSPERIRGKRAIAASDTYSLGILLYEALTGFPPFTATDSQSVRRRHLEEPHAQLRDCGPLAAVVDRCLQKEPTDRYPTILAAREALSRLGGAATEPMERSIPVPLDVDPGPVHEVVGSYEILEPLGEGAMGRVFLARHRAIGRQVALKILKPELTRSHEQVQRFFQEAQAVNRVNHEHIVEIFDFVDETLPGDGGRRIFCVMELLRGETLTRLMQQPRGLPLPRALRLLRQVCTALDAAHRVGVIHRDLKPDNVFVTDRFGGDFVKVLDFGVAKLRADATALESTASGVLVGTPAYMAPEQLLGLAIDQRADVYSLGVVLYKVLAGRAPFAAADFLQLAHKVARCTPAPLPEQTPAGEPIPLALQQLVVSCLEKDAEKRPQTMAEVATALDGALAELGSEPGRPAPVLSAQPSAPVPSPRAPTRLPRWAVLALAAGGALGLALAGWGAWVATRAPVPEEPARPLTGVAKPAPPVTPPVAAPVAPTVAEPVAPTASPADSPQELREPERPVAKPKAVKPTRPKAKRPRPANNNTIIDPFAE